jgi:hypothetical protein
MSNARQLAVPALIDLARVDIRTRLAALDTAEAALAAPDPGPSAEDLIEPRLLGSADYRAAAEFLREAEARYKQSLARREAMKPYWKRPFRSLAEQIRVLAAEGHFGECERNLQRAAGEIEPGKAAGALGVVRPRPYDPAERRRQAEAAVDRARIAALEAGWRLGDLLSLSRAGRGTISLSSLSEGGRLREIAAEAAAAGSLRPTKLSEFVDALALADDHRAELEPFAAKLDAVAGKLTPDLRSRLAIPYRPRLLAGLDGDIGALAAGLQGFKGGPSAFAAKHPGATSRLRARIGFSVPPAPPASPPPNTGGAKPTAPAPKL